MKYLTLQIFTPDRGLVYEKHVRPADVFFSFMGSLMERLTSAGVIPEKGPYRAMVIPHCNHTPNFDEAAINALVVGDWEKPPESVQDQITLCFKDRACLNNPLEYFTLEILTPQRLYRKDFPRTELNPFVQKVGSALVSRGILEDGTEITYELIPREDNPPNFDEETIHSLPKEIADIQIAVVSRGGSDEEDIPSHSLSDYLKQSQMVGQVEANGYKIFIRQTTLQALEELARSEPEREIGGVLVGEAYRDEETGNLFTVIEDYKPAQHTSGDKVSLRFTHETWQAIRQELQACLPNQRVIGWYHTHLLKTLLICPRGHVHKADIFFSDFDRNMHQMCFGQPWQVALVLDGQGQNWGFYTMKEGKVTSCGGFYVVQQEGE